MGLVFDVCEPDELMPTTYRHAHVLADKPLASLMAVKETMVAPISEQVRAAKEVEGAWFRRLMGTGANAEALADFTGRTARPRRVGPRCRKGPCGANRRRGRGR